MGNNCCRVEERQILEKKKTNKVLSHKFKRNSKQFEKTSNNSNKKIQNLQSCTELPKKARFSVSQSPRFVSKLEKFQEIKAENTDIEEKQNDKSFEKQKKKIKKQRVNEKVISLKESKEKSVLNLIQSPLNNEDDKYNVLKSFDTHFFIRSLDQETRRRLVDQIGLYSVPKDTYIFQQGKPGIYFYIIKKGSVKVQIDGKIVKELSKGDSFGELALIHCAPRSASIISLTETQLYCIERKDFRNIVNSVNTLNYEENKKFIPQISILSHLDADLANRLCLGFNKEIYDEGSLIVKSGDMSSCLYVVKEGEVCCKNKNSIIRTLSKGDCFGEKSILMETVRSLDVIAKTKCTLLSISIDNLKSIFGMKYKELIYFSIIKNAFSKSNYFRELNFSLVENHFSIFKTKNFSKSQFICHIGSQMNEKMIFIIEGNVKNATYNEIVGTRCTFLFEEEIITNNPKILKSNYIADPDCLICECYTKDFLQSTGCSDFKNLFELSNKFNILTKINFFRHLSTQKIIELSKLVTIERFKENYTIFSQGEESNDLFILVEGKLESHNDKNERHIFKEFDFFGDFCFFFNENRNSTVRTLVPSKVARIKKDDLLSVIDIKMFDFMKNRYFLLDLTLQLEDFEFVSTLGTGSYGEVSLVYCNKNKANYAVKAIEKGSILYESTIPYLNSEKQILTNSNHPFIVKLVKTLKDKGNIYFVLEYIRGKELFEVIHELGNLKIPEIKFFSASMILAVNYLHERRIIYRDIKPENIMVNEKGFIKLIDFGTAKCILDRTSSIIGTPHYMAPEVILGEGYSFYVDYWSIAICMYEFVVGSVPFGDSINDPILIYKSITDDELKFPKNVKDLELKKLISEMLNKNLSKRISKFSGLKESQFFNNFSWDDLEDLKIEVPYVPKFLRKDELKPKLPFVEYMKEKKKSYDVDYSLETAEFDKFYNEF